MCMRKLGMPNFKFKKKKCKYLKFGEMLILNIKRLFMKCYKKVKNDLIQKKLYKLYVFAQILYILQLNNATEALQKILKSNQEEN